MLEIRRREFIVGLGGGAAWPLVARAQQGERVRRIGFLYPFPDDGNLGFTQRMAALRQGLSQFGWIEGRNIRIDAYHGPKIRSMTVGQSWFGPLPM
jgi:putative ABC transport system substrate-binding protein